MVEALVISSRTRPAGWPGSDRWLDQNLKGIINSLASIGILFTLGIVGYVFYLFGFSTLDGSVFNLAITNIVFASVIFINNIMGILCVSRDSFSYITFFNFNNGCAALMCGILAGLHFAKATYMGGDPLADSQLMMAFIATGLGYSAMLMVYCGLLYTVHRYRRTRLVTGTAVVSPDAKLTETVILNAEDLNATRAVDLNGTRIVDLSKLEAQI